MITLIKRLTYLAMAVCLSIAVSAIGAEKKDAKKPAAAKEKAYVCAHCKAATTKPGDCAKCKAKLAAVDATYACPKCGAESAKPGKCAKCKADLARSAAVYHCDRCGKDVAAAGT